MKGFLKSMTLARWIILLSLLGSLGLAYNGWRLNRERAFLQSELEVNVPKMSQDIQVLARQYSRLYSEAEREGLKGQQDPETYIRELASHQRVNLGDVEINRQTPQSPIRGVVDRRFDITPKNRDRGTRRNNIANYMYLLEQQSRRVRVTNIRIEQEGRLKPWEIGEDRWKWEMQVTSRQKAAEQAP